MSKPRQGAPSPRGVPVEEPEAKPTSRLEAVHLTLGLFLLYLLGFVVSNVHFARYELIRLQLLETRYLSAALLFAVVCGSPFLLGALFADSLDRKAPEAKKRATVIELPIGMALSFGLGVVIAKAPDLIVGNPQVAACGFVTLFAYETGRHGYPFLLIINHSRNDVGAHLNRVNAILAGLLPLLLLGSFFSLTLYPYINPAFGGGAVWRGSVYVQRPGSTPEVITPLDAAILDRDSEAINLLVCSESEKPMVEGLAIPEREVVRIRIIGFIVLPDAIASLCGKTKAHNQTAQPDGYAAG